MNITEFIEARLAEDEQIARAAGEGERSRWAYQEWASGVDTLAGWTNGEVYRADTVRHERPNYWEFQYVTMDREGLGPAVEPPEGTHIARHDPDRVLRQAAALRAVVGRQAGEHREIRPYGICETCRAYDGHREYDQVPWPCPTARAIASIWCDHPDYQPEWAG